jgi:heme/copper-type cytochrome/quinol oxidase subunit 4
MVITRKQFAKWNWVSLIVTMIVGCLVVAGEVCVMYES